MASSKSGSGSGSLSGFRVSGFLVSGFHGFMASSKSGSGSGSLSGSLSGFRVSWFQVSWFQGFIQIGVGIGIAIGIAIGFQGFMVSGFWFHGFIQIGVGIGIAIGIDCFTTEHNRLTVSPPHSLTAFEIAGSARISIRCGGDRDKTQCLRGFARILPVQLLLLGLVTGHASESEERSTFKCGASGGRASPRAA